jgi:hypothetical protein
MRDVDTVIGILSTLSLVIWSIFKSARCPRGGKLGYQGILLIVEISVFLMLDSWHFLATSNFETTFTTISDSFQEKMLDLLVFFWPRSAVARQHSFSGNLVLYNYPITALNTDEIEA